MSLRLLRTIFSKSVKARRQNHNPNIVIIDLPKRVEEPPEKTFKKGDKSPYAYNEYWEFPEDFKPWSFNYKGDGMLIGTLIALWFGYFAYEVTYLNRTGRNERPERVYYKP